MFQSRRRASPHVRRMPSAGIVLTLASLPLAACSSHHPSQQPSWAAAPASHVAAEARARTDVEDDGMEAQVPPPPTLRLAPDDPSEPFSRNYGLQPGEAPAAQPPLPVRKPAPTTPQRSAPRPRYASADGE